MCLISAEDELVDHPAAPCDGDGPRRLTDRVAKKDVAVRAVVESMNGARFVHDTLEAQGGMC